MKEFNEFVKIEEASFKKGDKVKFALFGSVVADGDPNEEGVILKKSGKDDFGDIYAVRFEDSDVTIELSNKMLKKV